MYPLVNLIVISKPCSSHSFKTIERPQQRQRQMLEIVLTKVQWNLWAYLGTSRSSVSSPPRMRHGICTSLALETQPIRMLNLSRSQGRCVGLLNANRTTWTVIVAVLRLAQTGQATPDPKPKSWMPYRCNDSMPANDLCLLSASWQKKTPTYWISTK